MSRVLIVDDAKFMRITLSNLLSNNGFTVVGMAENGQDALEQYKKLDPDIVTLDITMPVMDGLEALKKMMEYDPDAKVVMCSAMGQQKLVVEAIELGAKDFIVKPFDEQRVIDTLKNLTS